MADPKKDAALEQEIRKGRKFSLNDALGRAAGQGMMKGASPVPPEQQAEFDVSLYLRDHLKDASGVLAIVLMRAIKRGDLLLEKPAQPLEMLAAFLDRILQSPELLRELVRQADVEWGQRLGERPHFEREGQAPHADDPYTLASVRNELEQLVDGLSRR